DQRRAGALRRALGAHRQPRARDDSRASAPRRCTPRRRVEAHVPPRRGPRARRALIGVVLAGGLGTRLGEPKPAALLAGRPLISYPLDALRAVCERVVVACKRETELPPFAGVERWDEPDDPRHPIAGIVHALERAG